jgi:hypothetical protein
MRFSSFLAGAAALVATTVIADVDPIVIKVRPLHQRGQSQGEEMIANTA